MKKVNLGILVLVGILGSVSVQAQPRRGAVRPLDEREARADRDEREDRPIRDGAFARRLKPRDPPANTDSVYAPGVRLETPLYSGNGCPQGSMSTTLSPDNKTLSVLFDAFQAESGPNAVPGNFRKICRLRIPVRVSPGFQVAIVKTDFRGFNSLPFGAEARVKTVHNLSVERLGQHKMIDKKARLEETVFEGPIDEEFYIGSHIEDEQVWSPCGHDFSLNVGATVTLVQGPHQQEDALTVIDSLDVQTGEKKAVDYHFKWRRCK